MPLTPEADARAAGAPIPRAPAPPQTEAAPRFRRFVGFFLAWQVAWWSAIGWVAAPALPGGWGAVAGLGAVGALPLLVLLPILKGRVYPGAGIRLLVLRPFWYVQLALPLMGIVSIAGALAGAPFGAARVAGRLALAGALAAYFVLAIAGYFGSRALVVRRFEAAFEDLAPGLEGLRIAQLSDLHVGPHTPEGHLARIASAVREAAPDLIVYTGDQVDDHDQDVVHFARAFEGLRAPLGVFAIPGNHDVYAGWDGVEAGLARMGMTALTNDAVEVKRGGASLWIAGTGDPAGLHWGMEGGARAAPDVARTLARVPSGAFTLALAHNPALWPALAERGVHLTLSGHTHHGQISIPALGWCLASPFLKLAMGNHARGGSLLYINPGTNYWGLPLRLGAWPEVSIITLKRGPTRFSPTGAGDPA